MSMTFTNLQLVSSISPENFRVVDAFPENQKFCTKLPKILPFIKVNVKFCEVLGKTSKNSALYKSERKIFGSFVQNLWDAGKASTTLKFSGLINETNWRWVKVMEMFMDAWKVVFEWKKEKILLLLFMLNVMLSFSLYHVFDIIN